DLAMCAMAVGMRLIARILPRRSSRWGRQQIIFDGFAISELNSVVHPTPDLLQRGSKPTRQARSGCSGLFPAPKKLVNFSNRTVSGSCRRVNGSVSAAGSE